MSLIGEDTHKIPVENFELADQNYRGLWIQLQNFINPNGEKPEYPPLYCLVCQLRSLEKTITGGSIRSYIPEACQPYRNYFVPTIQKWKQLFYLLSKCIIKCLTHSCKVLRYTTLLKYSVHLSNLPYIFFPEHFYRFASNNNFSGPYTFWIENPEYC